jgi:hypothetical protein
VLWPNSASLNLANAKSRFLQIADDFTWINPHLTLKASWDGTAIINVVATAPAWPKWRPSDPTSPHWYTPARLERLIAAYVGHDQDRGRARMVREFVSEFRGFSGSAKQKAVLDQTGLSRAALASLCRDDDIDHGTVEVLLAAMKAHSKPVNPKLVGIIGKEHMRHRFTEAGAAPESFNYQKKLEVMNEVPTVVEVGFGYCPDAGERRLVTGVNWSPGISNPFRELGQYAASLDAELEAVRAGPREPVIYVIHMACPRVEYRDRGKSSVHIEDEP